MAAAAEIALAHVLAAVARTGTRVAPVGSVLIELLTLWWSTICHPAARKSRLRKNQKGLEISCNPVSVFSSALSKIVGFSKKLVGLNHKWLWCRFSDWYWHILSLARELLNPFLSLWMISGTTFTVSTAELCFGVAVLRVLDTRALVA